MPPVRHQRRRTRPGPYYGQDTAGPSVQKNNYRLACPFCKRYPDRHAQIDSPCTTRWGFDSIRSVNEHLKRDHSVKYGCVVCKMRFPQCTNSTIEEKKIQHVCEPRNFAHHDPIWMNIEQEKRWSSWNKNNDVKRQDDVVKKYNGIYKSLFPDVEGKLPSPCPNPFYDFLQPGNRARLEHLHLRLCHHLDQNAAPPLVRRVKEALRAAEILDVEIRELGLAVREIDPDPVLDRDSYMFPIEYKGQGVDSAEHDQLSHQLRAANSLTPVDGYHPRPKNAPPSQVDRSLAFGSSWSLEFNHVALKEREIHQNAAQWANLRVHDSGYYSLGSNQQAQQPEIHPSQPNLSSTQPAPANATPNTDYSTQGTPSLQLNIIGGGWELNNTLSGIGEKFPSLSNSVESESDADDEDEDLFRDVNFGSDPETGGREDAGGARKHP